MARGLGQDLSRELHRVPAPAPNALSDAGTLRDRFLSTRDPAALEAVVRLHGPMVLGVCRRWLRHRDQVDDAFQATFLVFVRRSSQLRDWERLGPWLHEVATRVSRRCRINEDRRRSRESLFDREPPGRADPAISQRELAYVLDSELERLPSRDRDVIILCDLQGHTHGETALRLGIPVGTVKSRQARARAKLRERLARRGMSLQASLGLLAFPTARLSLAHHHVSAAIRAGSMMAGGGAVSMSVRSLAGGVSMMMWSTRWLQLVLPALLVGTAAYAIAQVPVGISDRSQASAPPYDPEQSIRRIEKEWGEAIVNKDAEAVAPFLADDFLGTDRNGNVFDKPTYLADLKKGFGTIKVEFEDAKIRVYGDAVVVTGIVRYTNETTTKKESGPITIDGGNGAKLSADSLTLLSEGADRYTATYVRQRGRWRCVVHQASRYIDINGTSFHPTQYFENPARPIQPSGSSAPR